MGEDRKEFIRLMSRFSAVGIEMGFSVVIGLLMGIYLDKYFKTDPWLTIIFLLFGLAASFKVILRVAKEGKKEEER